MGQGLCTHEYEKEKSCYSGLLLGLLDYFVYIMSPAKAKERSAFRFILTQFLTHDKLRVNYRHFRRLLTKY